jgi:hypothetical protein
MSNFDSLTDMADAQCLRETRDKADRFMRASAEVLDQPELSDEEIEKIFKIHPNYKKFARAILKAQKEKK